MRSPYTTFTLIGVNALLFFFTVLSPSTDFILDTFGTSGVEIFEKGRIHTLLTGMFLHLSLLHLLGNMWFLFVFGRHVEDQLGKAKFILLFLVAGIVGFMAHLLVSLGDTRLVVGSSAAVSGVLGAYLFLFPKNKIRSFFLIIVYPLFFTLPAWTYLIIWLGLQGFYSTFASSVAYVAHIAGFIAGYALTVLLNKRVQREDIVAEDIPKYKIPVYRR